MELIKKVSEELRELKKDHDVSIRSIALDSVGNLLIAWKHGERGYDPSKVMEDPQGFARGLVEDERSQEPLYSNMREEPKEKKPKKKAKPKKAAKKASKPRKKK